MHPAGKRGLYFAVAVKQNKLIQYNFRYDNLTIYDGSTNTSPRIGKYCGNSLPSSVISSTNKVFIHFKTDGSGTSGKSFKLQYHPISKYIMTQSFQYVQTFPACPNITLKSQSFPHVYLQAWNLSDWCC